MICVPGIGCIFRLFMPLIWSAAPGVSSGTPAGRERPAPDNVVGLEGSHRPVRADNDAPNVRHEEEPRTGGVLISSSAERSLSYGPLRLSRHRATAQNSVRLAAPSIGDQRSMVILGPKLFTHDNVLFHARLRIRKVFGVFLFVSLVYSSSHLPPRESGCVFEWRY